MYDYFRSSYDLGEQFTNVVCQTKDIEDGIGGTLTDYWLDPAGQLWYPNYQETHTFETIDENSPNYKPNKRFLNYEWVPTGKHGKYRPHYITKYIEIYPENWKGNYKNWPTMRIHFRCGKLQDYEDITNNEID